MNTHTATICHECGDEVNPGDEWYITATADQEVYGECCVDACDICGTTDKIDNLVEVFAEVAPDDIHRYHCQECHEQPSA